MLTALTNATLLTGTRTVRNKALLFDETGIKDIVDPANLPDDATDVDCSGAYVCPGLVDLQIYGAGGHLFSADPCAEALAAIGEAVVQSGTTSFLLTLATNDVTVFREALHAVQYHPHPALLGLHFEGPYINPEKRGAHLEAFIRVAATDEVRAMLAEAGGLLKMVTLAPERVDPAVIRLFAAAGVVVSAGHSNATFEEAKAGFAAGVKAVTHLFNAMSPLHHRATGLPGAAFLSGAYASIIADGIHVDYTTVTFSKKVMGDRLFLITDAVEEAGTGPYRHVRQPDRFTLPDGTLSGSGLTLLQAVKNCVQHCGIPLDEAVRMASLYPARLLGADTLGRLEPGAGANVLVFDESFAVQAVYLGGSRMTDGR